MLRPASSLWRLAGMVIGLLGVALGLVAWLSTWALSRTFDAVGRAVVADDLGEYEALLERDGVPAVVTMFRAGGHEADQAVRVIDRNGRVVVEAHPAGCPDWTWPGMPLGTNRLAGVEPTWVRRVLPDGTVLTLAGRALPGGGEIWFGRTDVQDREAIREVRGVIAGVALVVLVLAVGPVVWFAGQVLRPVHRLAEDAGRIIRDRPGSRRLEASGAIPEIRRLADAFNHTLERVQAVSAELESANDQLAHELRTPLARIRGLVEARLRHGDLSEDGEEETRLLAEIDRATRLVQTILTIRAGEGRNLLLARRPVSLSELAAAVAELYSAAAEERGLAFRAPTFRGGPDWVEADAERLQQAVCGLLDNALAYTPRGGWVGLEVHADGGWGVVTVSDNGPGLTGPDLDRIWRRFTRGSAAGAETPGMGLGLSLVRAIAEAHGGEAGVRNREGGGAEFWIRVPLTVAPEG